MISQLVTLGVKKNHWTWDVHCTSGESWYTESIYVMNIWYVLRNSLWLYSICIYMLDIQYNKYDQLCKLCLDSLWKFLFHFPSLTCFFSRETSPGSSIHLSQSQDVSPPTHLHVCHWQSLQPELFHRKNGKVGRSHRTKEPRFMGPKVQQIRWKIWTTTSRLTTTCKNAMFNTSNAHSRKTSQWQMKASCEGVVECPKSGVILLLRWIKSPVNSSIPNTWGSIGINLPGCLSSLVLKWATERERERWVYYSEGPERSLWSYWGLGKGWIIVHSTSELWKT